MNTKRIYLLSAVFAVALLALLMLTRSRVPEPQEAILPTQAEVVEDNATKPGAADAELEIQDSDDEFAQADEPSDPEIERLQEFLDDNDNESILAQAAFREKRIRRMAGRGMDRRRR